jgi:hypothetical protein
MVLIVKIVKTVRIVWIVEFVELTDRKRLPPTANYSLENIFRLFFKPAAGTVSTPETLTLNPDP